jgi:hypothetical protein
MKLAVIGADEESLNLVRWATQHGNHELVAAYDSDAQSQQLRVINPQLILSDNWEELFLASAADVVIVGRGGKEAAARASIDRAERRADQLRKLVQAAVPMIVVCPACEAIVGFEIEMIRRDTKSVIVPHVPGLLEPGIRKLEELVSWGDTSPLGKIEQIVLDREQADRSRESVLVQLSRDASALRRMIGTIQTVTASGPPPAIGRDPLGPKSKELPSLTNLTVHLGGDEGLSARWSLAPASGPNMAKLAIIGERGKASMTSDGVLSIEIACEKATAETVLAGSDIEPVFRKLSHAVGSDEFYDDSAWLAACHDQEAAEAVDRSLTRGRTIELFNEEHTEEESFKGVMAMGGCLLLSMALGVLFVAVVVEGLRLPMRSWPLWRLWPFYLLVPIVAFLLLQLLQLVIKREEGHLERAMTR